MARALGSLGIGSNHYNIVMSPRLTVTREQRTQARRTWPIQKFRLGAEPGDNLSLTTTTENRLEIMWLLALEAWSLTGQAIPDYERKDAPI